MTDEDVRKQYYCVSRIECIVGGYVNSSMMGTNAFQLVDFDSPKELHEKAHDLGEGSTIGCFIEHLKGINKTVSFETVSSISYSGELISSFSESTGGDYNSLSFRYKDNKGICEYNRNRDRPYGELHCGEKKS